MNKTAFNRRESLRCRGRQKYIQSLDSQFSYCGMCGVMLVWRVRVPDDHTYHVVDTRFALVTTPTGLRKVHRGTVDHILSIAKGGTNDLDNLAGLCEPCHRDKDEERPIVRRYTVVNTEPLRRLTFSLGEIWNVE